MYITHTRTITYTTVLNVKSLSHVQLFVTPWTVTYQVPLSIGFSRQEYWSGLPFPPPGDLPNPGVEPRSPTLQADALLSEPPGKPHTIVYRLQSHTFVCFMYFGRWVLHTKTSINFSHPHFHGLYSLIRVILRDPGTRNPKSTVMYPHGDNVTHALLHSHMPPHAQKCLCNLSESLKHKPIAIGTTTLPGLPLPSSSLSSEPGLLSQV